MEQRENCRETMARGGWVQQIVSSRSVRRLGGSFLGLGLVGALIAEGQCLAQSNPWRLTVRPREMATATRTARAGLFRLDTPKQDPVYVPPQCVGPRRCPLIVFIGPGEEWGIPQTVSKWLRPVADRYGMIILAPYREGGMVGPLFGFDVDAALTAVLRTVAIDPDKIAVFGRCNTGWAVPFGQVNLDVFSRMGSFTANSGNPARQPNQTNEFLLATAINEGHNLEGARKLRDKGYPVKHLVSFRDHEHRAEDYDFMGRWLQESWAIPDPAARPAPYAFGDPPLLTLEVIRQMTAFWNRFQQEPESIRTTARLAHRREVTVPVGSERTSLLMVDMAALAARHPSVAAALKTAGLTAQQHDASRAALASAKIAKPSADRELTVPVEATSVLAKNIVFVYAYPDEFQALKATEMWTTP